MRDFDALQAAIVLEVVERHRGSDPPGLYLDNLCVTLKKMLDGRRVHPRHIEEAVAFFEDLSNACLREVSKGRRGCF